MERNSLNSQGYKLESQIREAFGRIVYSQTCHEKKIQSLIHKNETFKLWQIILSALATGTFLSTIFCTELISGIIGSLISMILLIINSYMKNSNLEEVIQNHKNTANLLWKIREEYVTLLTDFEILSVNEIRSKRDELQDRTSEVYSKSHRTDSKSYEKAQKALKNDEEQTFSEHEIDIMLPNSIRRENRNII